MKEKKIKTWQHLLAIPIMAVIDIIVLVLAVLADSSMAAHAAENGALGHGGPFITILVLFPLGIASVIVLIVAIVKTVSGYRRKARAEKEAY